MKLHLNETWIEYTWKEYNKLFHEISREFREYGPSWTHYDNEIIMKLTKGKYKGRYLFHLLYENGRLKKATKCNVSRFALGKEYVVPEELFDI